MTLDAAHDGAGVIIEAAPEMGLLATLSAACVARRLEVNLSVQVVSWPVVFNGLSQTVGSIDMKSIVFACVFAPALAIAGEGTQPWVLDDLRLDAITAGAPSTAILLQAAVGTDTRAGGPEVAATLNEQPIDDFFDSVVPSNNRVLAGSFARYFVPGRNNVGDFFSIAGGGSVFTSTTTNVDGRPWLAEVEAKAENPSGSAEGKAYAINTPPNDFFSLTIGGGTGKTAGDGAVDLTGVVVEGTGVGTGYAVLLPGRDRILLLGIAAAGPSL